MLCVRTGAWGGGVNASVAALPVPIAPVMPSTYGETSGSVLRTQSLGAGGAGGGGARMAIWASKLLELVHSWCQGRRRGRGGGGRENEAMTARRCGGRAGSHRGRAGRAQRGRRGQPARAAETARFLQIAACMQHTNEIRK